MPLVREHDESEADFLHRLEHDLRGPLNAILLSAQALEAAPGEAARRLIGAILRQGERLGAMLDQVGGRAARPTGPGALAGGAEAEAEADPAERMAVLLVEDNPDDAARLQEELAGLGVRHLDLLRAGRLDIALDHLARQAFDVILLDLYLPDSHGLDTVVRTQAAAPGVAIVVLSNVGDRRTAVQAVRHGAQDYLIKGQVSGALLVRALEYACERKRAELERERLIAQLQEALNTVKRLSGLLPICANCKRIRDEGGDWQQIEQYLHEHSEADFSHGLCPHCAAALYPEAFS